MVLHRWLSVFAFAGLVIFAQFYNVREDILGYKKQTREQFTTVDAKITAGNDKAPQRAKATSAKQNESNPPPTKTTKKKLPLEGINDLILVGGQAYSLPFQHQENQKAPRAPDGIFPLPKPILVMGLPKVGTTSLFEFFKQMPDRYTSSHWICGKLENGGNRFCGYCMRQAIQENKKPLESCGAYDVWAQMDTIGDKDRGGCYLPQMVDLDILHEEAPNATFILNRRNMTQWLSSLHRWVQSGKYLPDHPTRSGLPFDERFALCGHPFPNSTNPEVLEKWHLMQIQNIRDFVHENPSHALVEIDIEDPVSAQVMATVFQAKEEYWVQANKNTGKKKRKRRRKRTKTTKATTNALLSTATTTGLDNQDHDDGDDDDNAAETAEGTSIEDVDNQQRGNAQGEGREDRRRGLMFQQ